MDPADGIFHKATFEKFREIWTGVIILVTPGPDFQPVNEITAVYKRYISLLVPHQSALLLALLGAILYTVLGLSTSIYIQMITDFVLVDRDTGLLNHISWTMLILTVFQVITGIVKNILVLRTGQQIDSTLILGYYNHLLKLPQYFFDTMRVGEIISRVNDAVKIRAFINDIAISLLVSIFTVIFSFGLMFVYSWKLAILVSAVVPVYGVIFLISNTLNKKRERKLMEDTAELESQLVESLNSVRTIKEFGLEKYSNSKTEDRFFKLMKSAFYSSLNSLYSSAGSELTGRIVTVLLLWFGSYLVIGQKITPGELLSYYAIAVYFTGPVSNLVGMNKAIQNALIAADRLFEIMDLAQETNDQNAEFTSEKTGDIQFREVCFTYGTRTDVFDCFTFCIKKGEITAVVGESGSGKSTMVAIILKLYPMAGGSITIGDMNIEQYSTESMRKLIGVVPQRLDLFTGTLAENIAIGDENPDCKKILDICSSLGMRSFIEELPESINSRIGENGTTLSGGEKQKIAIARALYRDPEIILFDEATSSLDNESEFYVLETINKLKEKGKTILVIAHRLSTVIHADRIAVLEKGIIVEEGNHQYLWNKKGKYYDMWQKQLPFPEVIKQMGLKKTVTEPYHEVC